MLVLSLSLSEVLVLEHCKEVSEESTQAVRSLSRRGIAMSSAIWMGSTAHTWLP